MSNITNDKMEYKTFHYISKISHCSDVKNKHLIWSRLTLGDVILIENLIFLYEDRRRHAILKPQGVVFYCSEQPSAPGQLCMYHATSPRSQPLPQPQPLSPSPAPWRASAQPAAQPPDKTLNPQLPSSISLPQAVSTIELEYLDVPSVESW